MREFIVVAKQQRMSTIALSLTLASWAMLAPVDACRAQDHDTSGSGRYDELRVETRLLKNPRAYDSSGIPFHADAQTIVKERFYQDKDKPDVLHDEITTIDHALTRPWTVVKNYIRVRNPIWVEAICAEQNDHIKIGGETYMLNADGRLMPAKKGQKPPDLSFFNTPAK